MALFRVRGLVDCRRSLWDFFFQLGPGISTTLCNPCWTEISDLQKFLPQGDLRESWIQISEQKWVKDHFFQNIFKMPGGVVERQKGTYFATLDNSPVCAV